MIIVDHVTKFYGAHPAVRDLDFRIEEGECVGFLGLNGAGKTTTLRLLSCLLLPTSGRISIRGLDAETDPHEIRKFIGFLPDTPPVYEEMTVGEYLGFAGKLRRMNHADLARRLPEVLATCGLEGVASQSIATLSHGYRQRVGIAQAIIHEPALLILDEPIQGLDPVQIVEMREMIRALRGKHTILLSTHILSEIEQTCDRILILQDGRVAAQGSERDLAERFAGDRIIEIEVRFPEEASTSTLAEALAELTDVVAIDTVASDGPIQRARVSLRRDAREPLARALIEAGLGLRGLREVSTGLEGIFVRLSRGTGGAAKPARPQSNAPAAQHS